MVYINDTPLDRWLVLSGLLDEKCGHYQMFHTSTSLEVAYMRVPVYGAEWRSVTINISY